MSVHRRRAGLCVTCGAPATVARTGRRSAHCRPHLDAMVESMRRRNAGGRVVDDFPEGYIQVLLDIQGGRCAYCSARLVRHGYDVEHVIPLNLGGYHCWGNVVLACRTCNREKGQRTAWDWRPELLGDWADELLL